MNKKIPLAFVAYPSQPPSLVESIEKSINSINESKSVKMCSWKSVSTGGRMIITAICNEIDQCDLFIADITMLNHNVLFELGFAIAKGKRIWLLNDISSEKNFLDFKKFQLLTTVGYTPYSNSDVIQEAFYMECPHEDLDKTLFSEVVKSARESGSKGELLYLKSSLETEASVKLTRNISRLNLPTLIDDPSEVPVQSLSWYINNAYSSKAVIAHFLSSDHTGSKFHNAKNSFVCGLAYGFCRRVLMLAHEPYDSPIDYREMLKTHKTAAQCDNQAKQWLAVIQENYHKSKSDTIEFAREMKAREELRNITIGDPIAENESDELLGYFVRTGSYEQVLRSKRAIFVGRRGTGKTAFLYHMANELGSDKRNHVCVIKPVAYELDGLVRVLEIQLPRAEKGFMIESLWKYLIYSELAQSYYKQISSLPSYHSLTNAEEELIDFCSKHKGVILQEFSVRMENVLLGLQHLEPEGSAESQRNRISERLHQSIIGDLRLLLGKALEGKNQVAIIVDNLDKNWTADANLDLLSQLIFALLGVSRRITMDFEKADQRRRPVNLSLTLFLRSDIFSEVLKRARERDKISYFRILWEEPELLLSIIEERLFSSADLPSPKHVWNRFFCSEVMEKPVTEFLTQSTLPRPRDIILLVREALLQAYNRNHLKIEEDDLIDAQRRYSKYALESLIAENVSSINNLEDLLYEFVGSPAVITSTQVGEVLERCGISKGQLSEIINLLCNLTFLGREVEKRRFEYQYNNDLKTKYEQMAKKLEGRFRKGIPKFRINKPFHSYLEITE